MKKNFQFLQSYTEMLSIRMTISGGLINKKKLIKTQNNLTNTDYILKACKNWHRGTSLSESVRTRERDGVKEHEQHNETLRTLQG